MPRETGSLPGPARPGQLQRPGQNRTPELALLLRSEKGEGLPLGLSPPTLPQRSSGLDAL